MSDTQPNTNGWQFDKRYVESRLGEIAEYLKNIDSKIDKQHQEATSRLHAMDKRVTLMEDFQKRQVWWTRAAITAALSAVVASVRAWWG